jgi:hypothetical protein
MSLLEICTLFMLGVTLLACMKAWVSDLDQPERKLLSMAILVGWGAFIIFTGLAAVTNTIISLALKVLL